MVDREPVADRSHSTYQGDNWEVLDMDSVDRVFAVESPADDSNPPRVRLDVDGFASSSAMRTLAEEGDNVNTSIWLTVPDSRELLEQLSNTVDTVSDESQRTIECPDCFSEVECSENTAVLRCPVCDGLVPIDDRAAELIAEGLGSEFVRASHKAAEERADDK